MVTADSTGQNLTTRQREILRFIVRFWGDYGVTPTLREVGAAFDISSPNGVVGHLRALAAKGRIVWSPKAGGKEGRSRSIVVPDLIEGAKAVADAYLAAM